MFLAKRLIFHHDVSCGRSMVVNGVSGAVDLLPLEFAQRLEVCRGRELPEDLCLAQEWKLLEERGYLFAWPDGEEQQLRDIYQRLRSAASPLTKFVICPTYTCNLACTYCYEGDLTRRRGVMSFDQLDRAIEAIDVLKKRPEVDQYLYELFGGEPLLPSTRPLVERFLEILDERGGTVAIVTNGTHLEDFLPLFLAHPASIESLQVTLDGPREMHDRRRIYRSGRGSFDRIVHGVDQLLEEGFFVRLRVNVDRQNLKTIPELLNFIERRDWPQYKKFTCDIAPVTYHTQRVESPEVMTEDEIVQEVLDEIPELLRYQSYCKMGMFRVLNHVTTVLEPRRARIPVLPSFTYCEATEGSIYVFGTDGAIYTCPDSIIDRKWAVGEYWPQFRLDEEKIGVWRRDIFSAPVCKDCEIATFCGGGCALVPMDKGSDHPFCNGAREALHTYLGNWFRRHPEVAEKTNSATL